MNGRKTQLSFLPKIDLHHGGTTRTGRRKIARPLDPKRPIHVTLKSTKARGVLSLLRPLNAKRIQAESGRIAIRHGVRIYQFANSGNHLHMLLSGKTRKSIQDFMKALSSRIAQLVTGAKKGNAFGKFWDATFFSRVVSWGRDFTGMRFYVLRNELVAEGWAEHDRTLRRKPPPNGTKRAEFGFPRQFGRGL